MQVKGAGNFPAYRRPMDTEDDANAVISSAIKDAIAYVEDELAPERVLEEPERHIQRRRDAR